VSATLHLSSTVVDMLYMEDSLLDVDRDGAAMVVVSNTKTI